MHGIGGCTVAEAQERMSYHEFTRWVAFRNKRGSLHTGMRIEHAGALIASILANVNSKKGGYKLIDFMPHQEEAPVSLEKAMELWK
ncbi:phage tail assembly protein T [Aidingimonas halophila]|uniref:Minor tail T domain-containing protein n=1 Tax=Aidingimonas halophila TaxID=574349 RepID=A0A1H2RE18_9GAMM|nr:hypothetical protein [Aidingimonas halophila]GHC19495.1 hypothetical protein GCM10008094_06920 [Aidingimonas halophila]SDW16909.1 hypothetical protein SAMN05443545_101280 [Aidingimonas halophila]